MTPFALSSTVKDMLNKTEADNLRDMGSPVVWVRGPSFN